MFTNPLVTVYTLIYNTKPEYIIEAILSVQSNKYPNIQHIIVDDCSTNIDSKEQVKTWIKENSYKCIFLENDNNIGIAGSINKVLAIAEGKYILPCCDDRILPNRISGDVEMLEKSEKDIALIFSICQNIDSEGNKIGFFSPTLGIYDENESLYERLLNGCFIKAPSVTIKTDLLKRVGGYDTKYLIEDYSMWLKLSKHGFKFKYRPELTTEYRINPNSFTQSKYQILIEEDIKIKLDFANNNLHRNIIERYIFKQYIKDPDIGKILANYYIQKYKKTFFALLIKNNVLPKFIIVKIFGLYIKFIRYANRK